MTVQQGEELEHWVNQHHGPCLRLFKFDELYVAREVDRHPNPGARPRDRAPGNVIY
jgi:hypothetical protein